MNLTGGQNVFAVTQLSEGQIYSGNSLLKTKN